MIDIIKATIQHCKLLADLSVASFLVPHGKSASKKDIDTYIFENFSEGAFKRELLNPDNEYYILYYKDQVAGYSKVIFNVANPNIARQNITKMERLYLLEEFYGKKLGIKLFDFNVKLSKENQQQGMWLAVWIENHRAINFYKKTGFTIVGSYDFKVSETHSNPNHIMYLQY